MPCFLVFVALFLPRVTLFFIWILTSWFNQAFSTTIWPILGFLFMPYTTLAYMAAMLNNDQQVSGFWLFLIIVAVLCDLSGHGEAARQKGKMKDKEKGI